MSAMTLVPETTSASVAATGGRVTFARVVRAEWTKLRSLRSTWFGLLTAVVSMVGVAAIVASAARSGGLENAGPQSAALDATSIALAGAQLAQLALGVLGVLVMTSEYATGLVRTTFTAVPRRGTVLAAKVTVFGAVALVVSAVASFASFAVSQAILSGTAYASSLSDPGVLRALLGSALYLTGVGLVGVALGALLRRTPGAISALVGVVLILPVIVGLVPAEWASTLGDLLPASAGQALTSSSDVPGALTYGQGSAVLAGYVVAGLGASWAVLRRRDA